MRQCFFTLHSSSSFSISNAPMIFTQANKKGLLLLGEGPGERRLMLEHGYKHLTGATYLHLFFPVFLYRSFTNGSVNKPAKIAGRKFPGRAALLLFRRTLFDHPASLCALVFSRRPGYQKINLTLDMHRHRSPALLITVNGF